MLGEFLLQVGSPHELELPVAVVPRYMEGPSCGRRESRRHVRKSRDAPRWRERRIRCCRLTSRSPRSQRCSQTSPSHETTISTWGQSRFGLTFHQLHQKCPDSRGGLLSFVHSFTRSDENDTVADPWGVRPSRSSSCQTNSDQRVCPQQR